MKLEKISQELSELCENNIVRTNIYFVSLNNYDNIQLFIGYKHDDKIHIESGRDHIEKVHIEKENIDEVIEWVNKYEYIETP